MSDEAVEKLELESEVSDIDITSGEVEASGDGEVSGDNPTPTEFDVSGIEIDGSTGSQPDGEERKRNHAFAAQRVKEKELKEELERLKSQSYVPDHDNARPKRTDFLNDDVLYEKYGGNTEMARAAFEDARDEFDSGVKTKTYESITKTQTQLEEQIRLAKVHEDFDVHAEQYVTKVKDLDTHLMMGERNLTFRDMQGNVQDGSIIIKERFGGDAPLMIAAIGANKSLGQAILAATDQFTLAQRLNSLQTQVRANISSNALSKAQEEVPAKGDASTSISPKEKAMAEAAKNGDYKEYQRLQGRDPTGRPLGK